MENHIRFNQGTASGNLELPGISGNIVVWTQDRRDIFTYNLENNEKSQVSTPRTGGIKYIPKISNDIIVWGDTRNTNNTRDGNSDIYAYNLSTGEEFQVTSNPYGQWAPDVSGNVIVWQDDRNGNLDIYGYNLDTKTEFQITTDEADQQQPRVSGDIVIWEDRRNDNYTPSLCPGPRCDRDPDAIRFYAYDLTTFTEFPLPFNSEAIDGELVVGHQNTPMGDRISVFNIRSQEKVASWIVPLNAIGLAISGDAVVWHDNRVRNSIYGFDLRSMTEFQITQGNSARCLVPICGGLG